MEEGMVNLSREKIVQLSLVVKDLEKTARRFSEIFGVHWKLYRLLFDDVVLHGKKLAEARCDLRISIGHFGGRSLKLIQPVSGQSSYAEFLQHSGEGFYALGFGTLLSHDEVLGSLNKAGIVLEFQGDSGDGSRFSILDFSEDCGCRIEFSSPATMKYNGRIQQTGAIEPPTPVWVNMETPILPGGKRLNQVGMVVRDEKKAASRFEELLGIGGWNYAYGPPGLINAHLNGEPVRDSEMESLDVAFAMGWLGDLQIEIIRPIGIRPGGCHQRFLDTKGNGIQHVSFGIQADFADVVDGMKKAGIGAEFMATIKEHGVTACYFASQEQLGGFQLEIVGRT